MRHRHRLRKLEATSGLGECPECGWSPPSPGDEIVVEWADLDDPDLDEDVARTVKEPTICPTCGQPDFIVVTWQDLDLED